MKIYEREHQPGLSGLKLANCSGIFGHQKRVLIEAGQQRPQSINCKPPPNPNSQTRAKIELFEMQFKKFHFNGFIYFTSCLIDFSNNKL